MTRRAWKKIPSDLRQRLENARLDLLALFRALDQLDLTPYEIPQPELHTLFELDGDYAEALYVLDQRPPNINVNAMLSDTLAALEALPTAREEFLDMLAPRGRGPLKKNEPSVRATLTLEDAYHSIPGRDPHF